MDFGFTPSKEQNAIFDFLRAGGGNGVVDAVAGSGKSTTIAACVQIALDILNGRADKENQVIYLAFNKHVTEALNAKMKAKGLPPIAKTTHALGLSNIPRGKKFPKMDGSKYRSHIYDKWDELYPDGDLDDKFETCPDALKLCDFIRITLTDPKDVNAILQMASLYQIPVSDESLTLALEAVEWGEEQAKIGPGQVVDFIDMIWLPNFWNLRCKQFEYIFLDEAQDLNEAQIQLVKRSLYPGGRIIAVGDPYQAIQLFAGARSDSIQNIIATTGASTLPLTTCYRCPDEHLQLARQYVPHITARPNATAGSVSSITAKQVVELVKPGDMVVGRYTAPLVSLCLYMISRGLKANVRGRDIGKDLVTIVKKAMKDQTYDNFPQALAVWRDKQAFKLGRKKNSEAALEALEDRYNSVIALWTSSQATDLDGLIRDIEAIFSDEITAIVLSTIHRAKGLEANTVFVYGADRLPARRKGMSEEQFTQEKNLHYVALTRALSTLYLVKSELS